MTRRRFLGGSIAAAGAGLLAGCSSSAPSVATTAPTRDERRKVIVIGTGFGGSVTALRLAQRGVDVTLIERGKRWKSGERDTFATFAKPDRRVSWLSETNSAAGTLYPSDPWKPYTGLMERIPGDGMDVVCAAAVGGGSLPYHGMTLQPRGDLFDQVMPDELDYDEFDERWYPLVRKALSATPIPDDVLASDQYEMSRRFISYVQAAGLPDAAGVPMPIDWDAVRREINGELPPSISTGDVIYGVNGPGKHSLDTNYLPAAEETGHVDLLPLHRVERIRRTAKGDWEVQADRLDTDGNVLEHVTMTGDALFLCAGSPNTTKLLVRAAGNGDIGDLPDDVGGWWSTNGDLLTTQFLASPTGAFQGGPASIGSLDWDNPAGPVTVLFAPVPFGSETRSMETIGMFIPDGHGTWSYDQTKDQVGLRFPASAHGAAMAAARARVTQVGKAAGATGALDITEQDPATFHPLGGAVIGKVCDAYGRVLDQPGLYVNDGALIPGSTACANPSLTIAALAERNIRQIIRQDLGTVF
ncbi:MAG TPA: FAD-dependent oxidoreductase [Acidimicrobiales bacterium]|nr:FAD-dependent oxidoreductase [Acidimicrobiales bacterium]